MELNKFTLKLVRQDLQLQEYDFEIIHEIDNTNLDIDKVFYNLSFLKEDLNRA